MTSWRPMDYTIDFEMPVKEFDMLAGSTFSALLRQGDKSKPLSAMIIIPKKASSTPTPFKAWVWMDNKNTCVDICKSAMVTLNEYSEPGCTLEEIDQFRDLLPVVFSARVCE